MQNTNGFIYALVPNENILLWITLEIWLHKLAWTKTILQWCLTVKPKSSFISSS